ncbi:hypothetical protein UPYG_G00073950 [Umbra pygmaea]|uniref:Chemokine interleukin-8-like domain-containing protein n=1 Tax=Umbra pygmaea TaxID=75934 RepID=A0ABD0XCB1_UMBPY
MPVFQSRRLTPALLFTMCVVLASVSANLRRPTKVTTTCCTNVSSTYFTFPLKGFRIQHSMPPCVDAILFYRVRGGRVCTNPKAIWAKEKMQGLKEIKK